MNKLKIVLIYSIVFGLLVSFGAKAYAMDATGSSEMNSKLQNIKDQIASKASALKQDVVQKLQNRFWTSTIKSLGDSSLELDSTGSAKVVSVDNFTVYQTNNKSLKDLKVGDTVSTLGEIDDKGVLVAKRIVKYKEPPVFSKQIVRGTLDSLGASSGKLLTATGSVSFKYNDYTDIYSGSKTLTSSDLKNSQSVIVSGLLDTTNKVIKAWMIYVIPSTSQATASASPKSN